MPGKRRHPYQYNLAEWLGVFFALAGTPSLLYYTLIHRGNTPTWSIGVWGVLAVAGWALLLLGTLAHRRTSPGTPA